MDEVRKETIYDLERQGRHADAQTLRQTTTTPAIERPPHDINKLRTLYAPRLIADVGFVTTRRGEERMR